MSTSRIIQFPFFDDDWKALHHQENSNENTASSSTTSRGTKFKLKLPASYNRWMSMKRFENGLQIILKVDQIAAEGSALYCLDSDWRAVLEKSLFSSEDTHFPDITLEVGTNKTPFRAHKLILALGCDVFKAMFYGPLAEKGQNVHIQDMSSASFKILLRYLYGSTIFLTDEDEAFSAWILADRYCVQKMKDECHNFFNYCILSTRNVWKLYEAADFFNMVSLTSRCTRFINKYMEASLCGQGFLEANLKSVSNIFKFETVRVSELFLMESLVHWGRHQVKIGEALSLRVALKTLLPNFRFGSLTPAEFCKFLDYSGDLLDESDAFQILKHLINPVAHSLPEWCCSIKWSRHLDKSTPSYNQYQCIYKYLEKKENATKKLKIQHNPSPHF